MAASQARSLATGRSVDDGKEGRLAHEVESTRGKREGQSAIEARPHPGRGRSPRRTEGPPLLEADRPASGSPRPRSQPLDLPRRLLGSSVSVGRAFFEAWS